MFREMVQGKYDDDKSAAFAVLARRVDDGHFDMELYCEGDLGIMCAATMDELAHIIVTKSKDAEQMRRVSMEVRRLLTRYCNEKWQAKTGEAPAYAVADGAVRPDDQCEGKVTMEELLNGKV